MDQDDFTPRNIAKFVVMTIIAGNIQHLTEAQIGNYTRFDKDSRTAEVVGGVVGWGISSKLKPVTDKIVDKTIDYAIAKNNERKAKKNDKKKD
jgi:transcriptional regulatory protein LevR